MKIAYILGFLIFIILLSNNIYGQVVIGHQPDKAIDKKHSLLELKVDNNKDTAQAFILPLAKTTQRDKITEKNGQTNNNKFPRGGMLYDVSTGKVSVYVKKDKNSPAAPTSGSGTSNTVDENNQWVYLSYMLDNKKVPILIARDSNSISSSDGSNNNSLKTITISAPDGYVPYTYNHTTNPDGGYVPYATTATNSGGSSSNPTDSVIVSLSYNGYTLTPYEDYKAEKSSGNDGKIKITFLSFEPEHKQDFDKIFVQYVLK